MLHTDDVDEIDEDTTPHPVTHSDALRALQAAGFRAHLENTGGGCMAYVIPLEGGRYVQVTSYGDVFATVRMLSDFGWWVACYCRDCHNEHDPVTETDDMPGHAVGKTEDSSADALVTLVRSVLLSVARGA